MAGKISLAINIVLIAAVAYLFTKGKGSSDVKTDTSIMSDSTQVDGLRMAFVNMDSLYTKYGLAQELSDKYAVEERIVQNSVQRKYEEVSQKMYTYETEVKNGLIPYEEAAYNNTMAALEKEMTDFQMAKQIYLDNYNQGVIDSITNTIDNYIVRLVEQTGFDYVIKDQFLNGPLLYRNDKFDLTEQAINELNAEYEAIKPQEEE